MAIVGGYEVTFKCTKLHYTQLPVVGGNTHFNKQRATYASLCAHTHLHTLAFARINTVVVKIIITIGSEINRLLELKSKLTVERNMHNERSKIYSELIAVIP